MGTWINSNAIWSYKVHDREVHHASGSLFFRHALHLASICGLNLHPAFDHGIATKRFINSWRSCICDIWPAPL